MTELILLIFGTRNYCVQFLSCRKSSTRLPLSGGGGLIYFKHILGRWGLNREGGQRRWYWFCIKKLKYKKLEVMQRRIENKSEIPASE